MYIFAKQLSISNNIFFVCWCKVCNVINICRTSDLKNHAETHKQIYEMKTLRKTYNIDDIYKITMDGFHETNLKKAEITAAAFSLPIILPFYNRSVKGNFALQRNF